MLMVELQARSKGAHRNRPRAFPSVPDDWAAPSKRETEALLSDDRRADRAAVLAAAGVTADG